MRLARICLTALAVLALACRAEPALDLDAPRAVSAPTKVGAAPMFAVSPAGAEAAAWVSAPGGGSDGRLYISTGGAAPVELRDSLGAIEAHGEAPPKIAWAPDGALYALYVVAREVPGRRFPASALRFTRSGNGGRTWSAPVTVTDDGTFGSHNFHSLHAARDGSVYVAWLDGRAGKSAVYLTRSTDGGRTWAANRRVDIGEACPCCRTALATAPDGTLYVAWRAVLPGSVRDIVIARSTDRGATWSEPARVHADGWVFDGCPHAGPSLQVDEAGRVHIAWWTGKEGAAGVWYARSDDGGTRFGAPVPIGVADLSRPAHVQLALARPATGGAGGAGTVVVAWDDGTLRTPRVKVRISRDGGATFGEPVAVSEEGRAATFPVLAVAGTRLTIAWSDESDAHAAHREHSRPNMKDPKAVMPLGTVGESRVLVRSGAL
ncbi:MAG TPA: sialidase family protein [Gemmatimonadaceae bacterium]|nr:sialidase family protein [Gemmatimonadaceae bacterium]